VSLQNWKTFGWLTDHEPKKQEIRDLLAVVERDLKSSAADGLDADWAMSIAYNAALQVGSAALAAAGYRAARDNHHFQSLAETLKTDAATIARFDSFRKKRHLSGYERVGQSSDADARAMRDLAVQLRDALLVWLAKNHPGLI
jgi:hypothetical protein